MTVEILLSRGYVAIIDDEDAHLAALKWHATAGSRDHIYGARNRKKDGKWSPVYLHREVMGFGPGDPTVDHISGDTLDCRRANLRSVTQTENLRNRAGPQSNGTSGHLGVSWNKARKKFVAYIKADGKHRHLGRFDLLEEAIEARLSAEKTLWGVVPRRTFVHGASNVAAS